MLNSIAISSNKQFLYLNPPNKLLTKHGERRPISAIVMLDRECGAGMEMAKASSVNILRREIRQHSSQHMTRALILSIRNHLIECTNRLRFRNKGTEPAAPFSSEALHSLPQFEAIDAYKIVPTVFCDASHQLSFDRCKIYVRTKHMDEIDDQTDCFVAPTRSLYIHVVNPMARAMRGILQELSKLDDIVVTFMLALPDDSKETLRHDIRNSLGKYAQDGLLDQAA